MVEVIAHRGASFDAPENSIEAFELAIRQGADRLELDVRLTRDGVPVVCHDADTSRVGEPSLSVGDCWAGDLSQVLLRNGESIPTLDEVCELARHRVPLDVEIKDGRRASAAAVMDRLVDHGLADTTLVTAFDERPLRALRDLDFPGRVGLLVGSRSVRLRQRLYEAWPLRALKRVGATDLVLHIKLAHRALRTRLRRLQLGFLLWAAMEDEMASLERCRALYRQALRYQPDGVIVGRVLEASEIFGEA